MGFPGGSSEKEHPCQCRRHKRLWIDFIFLGHEDPLEEGGHGSPLWYSCLESPTDRGAWLATVHRVRKSQTGLKQLSTCAPK